MDSTVFQAVDPGLYKDTNGELVSQSEGMPGSSILPCFLFQDPVTRWCNTRGNVMGETNYFLIRFKACSTV